MANRNTSLQLSNLRPFATPLLLLFAFSPVLLLGQDPTAKLSAPAQGKEAFSLHCAICHGSDARGGQYGPRLAGNSDLQGKPVSWFRDVIHNGIPSGGMPAFNLPDSDLDALAAFVHSLNVTAAKTAPSGDRVAGERYFFGPGNCSSCHMVDGRGAPTGPDLSDVANRMTTAEVRQSLLQPSASFTPGYQFVTVNLRAGNALHGFARSRSNFEIVLQDMNGKFHLLRNDEIANVTEEKQSPMPPVNTGPEELQNLIAYLSGLNGVKPSVNPGVNQETVHSSPPVESGGLSFPTILHPQSDDWLTYNGALSGNRYSQLKQINVGNVNQLQLKWIYTVPLWRQFYPDTPYYRENMQYFGLETTPLVADGIMYATGPQQAFALDARTGRVIWIYSRRRTPGLVGDGSLATNRGLAILGDKLFMITDDAHLIALNRTTGKLVWEAVMPEKPMHFGGTGAPLVINDLVIGGVSGADWGVRGFLAAYRASDGKFVWRHWTIPRKGDPGAETWGGDPHETGGGSTWTTGSYDPETDTLYWPTGNPFPDGDGADRPGDDLYTNGILALNPENGKLKWFYQVTPHDIHDWDTTAPLLLVDATFQGQQRKLLLHADKNGFFYVLDRVTGHVLSAKPFVKVTWASGIGPDGRPRRVTENGIVCPEVGTNWNAAAYSPVTHLYYLMAVESCAVEFSSKGGNKKDPEEIAKKYLEALDLEGKIVWKIPEFGPVDGKRDAGVLATAGGLLFYGDPNGDIVAANARSGKTLWHFPTSGETKASPMTYTVNGKQFLGLAVGPNILGFSLP